MTAHGMIGHPPGKHFTAFWHTLVSAILISDPLCLHPVRVGQLLKHPAFKEYDGVGLREGTLLLWYSRRINELCVDRLDRDGEEILFKPLSGITLRPNPSSLPVGK